MNPESIVEQLQPLREPAAVSWWPPAPGWWVLAALLAVALGLLARGLYRRYRRRAPLRAARRELAALQQQSAPAVEKAAALQHLWRRVAIAVHGDNARAGAGKLGAPWIAALNELAGGGEGLKPAWADLPYRPAAQEKEVEAAMAATAHWLRAVERRR